MQTVTKYTRARATFAKLCNRAASSREPVIIHRRNAEDVALVSVAELEGLMEPAHLLRSPRNAKRIFAALQRAQKKSTRPSTVEDLRRDVGLS